MDWFRQIQIHLFKGYNRATILVVIALIITRQIHAPYSYEFRLGTNGIISFSYALDEHFQYCWEIFREGVSDPFNINGTMKLDALNPSQRDRFNISTTWGEDVLRVDLHIREISKIDRGVYVWAVSQHTIRARVGSKMKSAVFVDVLLPLGRAKCDIRQSPYSRGLREIHCRASLGSDEGGLLICYQNDVKTPFQSPPKISLTDVSAIFWMYAQYDINCCSHEANYEKVPGECNDFTQTALDKSESQIATTTETIAKMPTSSVIRTTPYHGQSTTDILDSSQYAITNRDTIICSWHVSTIVLGIMLLIAVSIIFLLCLRLKERRKMSRKGEGVKNDTEIEASIPLN